MPATPSPIPQQTVDQIKVTEGVVESATLFIAGTADRVQAAVDKALENGATAEQLAPVQAEADALKAKTNDLAAAIAANP